MRRTVLDGELVIDHERGVVYFNTPGGCVLRICNLPTPIPEVGDGSIPDRMLDITHLVGQDWQGKVRLKPGDPSTLDLSHFNAEPPRDDPRNLQPLLE